MDYSNLKNKTIFNFTNDESIIEQCVPGYGGNDWKKLHMEGAIINRIIAMEEFAILTDNKDLLKAIEEQLSEEVENAFNE